METYNSSNIRTLEFDALIIGGGGNQKGTISSTMEVLKTDLLSKYNFTDVGVAGHPEGNPDISLTNFPEVSNNIL